MRIISPATALNHELDHGVAAIKDPDGYAERTDPKKGADSQYDNKEEKRVITGSEQKTAKALGEIKEGEVTRTNHKGTQIKTIAPTSTKTQIQADLENWHMQRKAIEEAAKKKKKTQNDN